MKKILLLSIICLGLTACTNNAQISNINQKEEIIEKNMQAIIKTNKGDIELKLYKDQAPITVDNFIKLAQEDYYNNIKFHRVIADFMIQTGDLFTKGEENVDFVYDPNNNPDKLPIAGTGGPGYSFKDEIDSNLKFAQAGVLAMANSGPNTNGSQIFITHTATSWLNGLHTIFGQVISGQDIVDAIEQKDYIIEIIIK